MIISVVFATIFSLISMFVTLYDFQHRVLSMRVGNHTFDTSKIDYVQAAGFVGSSLVNAIFAFLLFAFLITVMLTVILHPLFWDFIY